MDKIFLVQDKTIYYHSVEEVCQQLVCGRYFNLVIRKLCMKLKMEVPGFLINPKLRNAKKIIMTDTACHIGSVKTCCRLVGRENVCLYFMNTIDERNEYMLSLFDKKNIYTFDKGDAEKYEIHFLHTPFSTKFPGYGEKVPAKYDVLFLGREKGRGGEIHSIYDLCKENELKSKFLVLGSDDSEMKIDSFLPYKEYLQLVQESKAIAEIVKKGQEGCSLRYMEALFYQKKLITNNAFVVSDQYYNPDNVFLFGKDDPKTLPDFLTKEYSHSENETEMFRTLNLEQWLQNIWENDASPQ